MRNYNKLLLAGCVFFTLFPASSLRSEEVTTNPMPKEFLEILNPKFRAELQSVLDKRITVNFDSTHVREIIQHISIMAPLSIVIDETPFLHENEATASEAPYDSSSGEDMTEFSEQVKKSKFILSIHMNDIPVKELLWYLCQKTDLMAFFDEDIDKNIPGPIVITSKKTAEKIIQEKMARQKREILFRRALNTFKNP